MMANPWKLGSNKFLGIMFKHEPEITQGYFGQLQGIFHFLGQSQKGSDRPLDIHLEMENMFEPKPFFHQEKISIILKNRSRHVPSFGSL